MNNAFLQPQMPARQGKAFPHLQPTEEVLGLNIQAPSEGPGIPGLCWQRSPSALGALERIPPVHFVRQRIGSFF